MVDKDGNLFSATPSSGWLLGGAFVAGDTGVPLSNRMTVFDLDPLSPNVLVGGKRPRTTLTPTLVLKNGKPFLAISTPGGDSQDQQILNVLLEMIVFDKDIQEAIEAPRINSLHPFGSFDNHESQPGVLEIEDRVPADGPRRTDGARPQAEGARPLFDEHRCGRGRRRSADRHVARRRGCAARALHLRLVKSRQLANYGIGVTLVNSIHQFYELTRTQPIQTCDASGSCIRVPCSSDISTMSAVTGARLKISSPTASAIAFITDP